MLRRLQLRDFVIVAELDIELAAGFTVLTGETGAGKSILIDALQLALGQRAEASLVREGAQRAEVSAEFDTPPGLKPWLDEAGFAGDDTLLLRRTVDALGKSRAWVNGSPATVAQLREVAEHLVDIHGQHAWQSLTRPAAVRALLDGQAGVDPQPLAATWDTWRQALAALHSARQRRETLEAERQRLAWQLAELDKLQPADGEWDTLNAEHQRLAHGQALLDASRSALDALSEAEPAALALCHRAVDALQGVVHHDRDLQAVLDVLQAAVAQLQDAVHSLTSHLGRTEPDPDRLAELDDRLGAWMSQARRWRRTPAELPGLVAAWRIELQVLDKAADLEVLQAAATAAEQAWRDIAQAVSRQRGRAAPGLADAVTQVMQQLGMGGGRFEVALLPNADPQSFGLESVELRVAGHAGSTPRALGKVASGGELSRLALAIAVTTATRDQPPALSARGPQARRSTSTSTSTSNSNSNSGVPTLIFDEIDAGVGGTVADSVGRLMKQLGGAFGARGQVLAVTHLAQVAACADGHFVVSKAAQGRLTVSKVQAVTGEARVAEIARMLGGERLSPTSRAHAQALLDVAGGPTN